MNRRFVPRRRLCGILCAAAALLCAMLGSATVAAADRASNAAARVMPQLGKELAAKGLAAGAPIYIRIFKETSELELWIKHEDRYELFKTYPICYYSGNLGPKEKKGDGQAPEGFYTVGRSQLNPASQFHLSFDIGYPNRFDRAHKRTGSAIMVHGNCVSIGCFAMTDARIEEIYTLVDAALKPQHASVPVHIFPFRMDAENMRRFSSSRWIEFWKTLAPAYELFERTKTVPVTSVKGLAYVVTPVGR